MSSGIHNEKYKLCLQLNPLIAIQISTNLTKLRPTQLTIPCLSERFPSCLKQYKEKKLRSHIYLSLFLMPVDLQTGTGWCFVRTRQITTVTFFLRRKRIVSVSAYRHYSRLDKGILRVPNNASRQSLMPLLLGKIIGLEIRSVLRSKGTVCK